MTAESILLYFKQGSSDKKYLVHLEEERSTLDNSLGWVVDFAYGRRNGPQKQGTKTKEPVSYDVAKKIYDKTIKDKIAKGYTPAESGVAGSATLRGKEVNQTGLIPQLVNEITEKEALDLFYKWDGNLHLQTKWDGERRGVVAGNRIFGANRRGLEVDLPDSIKYALGDIVRRTGLEMILDCEDMGSHLVIFDILKCGIHDLYQEGFGERIRYLDSLYEDIINFDCQDVLHVDLPTHPTCREDVERFIIRARRNKEEGVIFREAGAIYTPGKPNSGGPVLKLKFKASATVQVIAHNTGKNSVQMGVRNPLGGIGFIGNLTIPGKYMIPPEGCFIEVEYLNILRGDGARLYQPQYKGLRVSKTEADWYSSLKFKKEEDE